jgi:hypothetical protein
VNQAALCPAARLGQRAIDDGSTFSQTISGRRGRTWRTQSCAASFRRSM